MTKHMLIALACIAVLGASALAAGKPAPPKGTATISLPGDAGMAFKPGPGAAAAGCCAGAPLPCGRSDVNVTIAPDMPRTPFAAFSAAARIGSISIERFGSMAMAR